MEHFTGMIARAIRAGLQLQNASAHESDRIDVGAFQQNASWGCYQAAVRLNGSDQLYRLVLAPANAPLTMGGIPLDQHFANPLEGNGI